MDGETEEYCYADMLCVELTMPVTMFDEIQASTQQQERFDAIVDKIQKAMKKQAQTLCDEIFGKGVIYVD